MEESGTQGSNTNMLVDFYVVQLWHEVMDSIMNIHQ
jgi:hypothetical protein